jgi:hypothetical protein
VARPGATVRSDCIGDCPDPVGAGLHSLDHASQPVAAISPGLANRRGALRGSRPGLGPHPLTASETLIVLHERLTQVQRRVTLAHELEHVDGHL